MYVILNEVKNLRLLTFDIKTKIMIKEDSSPYEKYLPLVAAVAMFMQSLDGTILNTSLPSIAADMNYSPLEMQSVIVSYTLTLALFIPLSGWLSDKFGTKRMFMFAVFLFTLGSFFCAISVDLLTLNLSRILQAVGGSMMVPIARLAILYQYPRNQLLKIIILIIMFKTHYIYSTYPDFCCGISCTHTMGQEIFDIILLQSGCVL